MLVHQGLQEIQSENKTVVTIGSFDGVHLAHRKIIELVKAEAQNLGLESAVITFWPHPRTVLSSSPNQIQLLSTPNEKLFFFEQLGIDHLYIIPFTKEFSNWSAQYFVEEILISRLKTQKIILGFDHHFGKNREGNLEYLRLNNEKFGIDVESIEEQMIHDSTISSSQIRQYLNEGKVVEANELLGYNYQFTGKVVKGNQQGRTIGFPTANIDIEEGYKLIPANGVYIVDVSIAGQNFRGIMNIGFRPTVDGFNRKIEVHIFEFDQDIYDQFITIKMQLKIRDEQKFESLTLLKNQIELDKNRALDFFATQA